jgi:quercetin dioxygenase-like cupin family protein
MSRAITRLPKFSASHLAASKFARRGLRGYFEYRDLGIKRATRGKVVAHVIRARPGKAPHGEWHTHDCEVQFVYVLKGWVLFEYEGVGKVRMKAGSCFYQPPRIRHRELEHSPDVEMLEVVSPASFKTASVKFGDGARTSPATRRRSSGSVPELEARKSRARRSRG